MNMQAAIRAPERGRFYLPVRGKFAVALAVALGWTTFSIWLSGPWVDELGLLVHPILALLAVSFIAYVPGFMNSFLLTSLLLDRRPARIALPDYPGLSVLIAAYQEENAIADTLTSLAASTYPGELEILLLIDAPPMPLARSPNAVSSSCGLQKTLRSGSSITLAIAAKPRCSTAAWQSPGTA